MRCTKALCLYCIYLVLLYAWISTKPRGSCRRDYYIQNGESINCTRVLGSGRLDFSRFLSYEFVEATKTSLICNPIATLKRSIVHDVPLRGFECAFGHVKHYPKERKYQK